MIIIGPTHSLQHYQLALLAQLSVMTQCTLPITTSIHTPETIIMHMPYHERFYQQSQAELNAEAHAQFLDSIRRRKTRSKY